MSVVLIIAGETGNLDILLVDATDSKGEPIHQTLMAKKMQRLDESPEFRPFKFRIQAFTNAFLEEASIVAGVNLSYLTRYCDTLVG